MSAIQKEISKQVRENDTHKTVLDDMEKHRKRVTESEDAAIGFLQRCNVVDEKGKPKTLISAPQGSKP